jgi:ATP/ADP translocase
MPFPAVYRCQDRLPPDHIHNRMYHIHTFSSYTPAIIITQVPKKENLQKLNLYADDKNDMVSNKLTELFFQVITSWQVIAVTIALVLFIYIVNYVSRSYHRPRSVSKSKPKKKKEAAAPAENPAEQENAETKPGK